MSEGTPYTEKACSSISEDALKAASAQFSIALFGQSFDTTQAPWSYAAKNLKATTSLAKKKDLTLSELITETAYPWSEAQSSRTVRILNSHTAINAKKDSAECYETIEVRDSVPGSNKSKQYITKTKWKRQPTGHWLITDYNLVDRPEGSSNATFTTGLHTPPETPLGGRQPSSITIGEIIKAMTAEFSFAINSHNFNPASTPWTYILPSKFRASMPPAEDHKMTLDEMLAFLQAVCKRSPTARSTIVDSNVLVREHMGWAEVWQNLELRDTARSKGVVHHYIEKMVWERQEADGRWLATEYRNILGLDRAGLPG